MNNMNWIIDTDGLFLEETVAPLNAEGLYTLNMGDFLQMPDMDFSEIAKSDADLRVLFN